MASRRTASLAEISLAQLRNCLVNIPTSLVNLLESAKTPAQNCIVELQYRPLNQTSQTLQSIYVGWTGFSSKPKATLTNPNIRQPSHDQSYSLSPGSIDVPTIELDASFARSLNIPDGAKVGVVLHLDPCVAHTVHIEPVTPADWDIIELHAAFLETNLLAQIRALPNPQHIPPTANQRQQEKGDARKHTLHPLTIHLSPTSTANVLVTQLIPAVPKDIAFAKIGVDSEVVVAPKSRTPAGVKNDSRSVNGSVRSVRTAGTQRQRSQRAEAGESPIFVRGVSEGICDNDILGDSIEEQDDGTRKLPREEVLQIWVDGELRMSSKGLRSTEWVSVSIVSPAGFSNGMDAQKMQRIKDIDTSEAGGGPVKIVARISTWQSAFSRTCVVLSNELCNALGYRTICGAILRLESASTMSPNIQLIKIYPFSASSQTKQTEGLKFGGETRAGRDAAVTRFRALMRRNGPRNLLSGPLTDGMIISTLDGKPDGWNGGILRFSGSQSMQESDKNAAFWSLNEEGNLNIEIQPSIARLEDPRRIESGLDDALPLPLPNLVGVEQELDKLQSHAEHSSSILLCGGQGCGKTAVAKALATRLKTQRLYHTSFLQCGELVNDELRVSAVKDKLQRIFMVAEWGSRLGGKSLIILDDLDKLCPAEQELQVGNDNVRSRQISELLCVLFRQFCNRASNVVLLATARGRDALHNVVVGGHILKETVELKAPDKAKRRIILAALFTPDHVGSRNCGLSEESSLSNGKLAARREDNNWMNGHTSQESQITASSPRENPAGSTVDLLDIAGRTDGYMPGDLHLLYSRARSAAMSRTILGANPDVNVIFPQVQDFQAALEGFTPATLRNVTLQSSSTKFSAIGGLRETRKTLLETLQYPTTYAPIFSQCPLRLRSGLLLYGYPGCGKTLLASAIAGECGLNFISVKGPEILNKYIGASEKSVRDLFERAQAAKPCVLFFDEFDSIAPKRGHDSTGVTDRVVNQLLTQMDGAEGLSGVYVLAATSRPDLIDPALLRPGRLDKSLLCDMPDHEDRFDILKALSSNLRVAQDIANGSRESSRSLHEVARRTAGYSGADLQAIIYNAHLEAIHDLLNDRVPSNDPPKTPNAASNRRSSSNLPLNNHELIQFRFGIEEDKQAMSRLTGAKASTERANLLAKLDAQRIMKRREREARRGIIQVGMNDNLVAKAKEDDEVVINWGHIERSLTTTRSSISARERAKLGAIYDEFIQGRNGEMPSGQGPMEIGARSSLM